MNRATNVLGQGLYANRLKGLRGAFDPDELGRQPDLMPLYVFSAILITLIVALLIIKHFRRRKWGQPAPRRPIRLFSCALKELGVGLPDRIMMRLIARRSELSQPSLMLFSPELLERHSREWLEAIPFPSIRREAQARLSTIAKKAFIAAEPAES